MGDRTWVEAAVSTLDQVARFYPLLDLLGSSQMRVETGAGKRGKLDAAQLPIDPRPIDLKHEVADFAEHMVGLARGALKAGPEPVVLSPYGLFHPSTVSRVGFIVGVFPRLVEADPDFARLVASEGRVLVGKYWRIVRPGDGAHTPLCSECGRARLVVSNWQGWRVHCPACGAEWYGDALVDFAAQVGVSKVA